MFSFSMTSDGAKQLKKTRRRNDSTATNSGAPSPDSLEPAIDGPPSPERIRAYTEQMKRSSIFGNSSRTNTISSSTSSSRSRGSTSASMERPNLSRQSSVGSRGSTMPPPRERPESIQIFGKQIFSRRKRRDTHEYGHTSGRSVSSLAVGEEITEEGPDENHGNISRPATMNSNYQPPTPDEPHARHFISTPFNFQHITHTRQNHLPNLERTGNNELLSEFVAIRASQAPLFGNLKGIQAQDLHFDNFSSESLTVPQQPMKYSQSHDNLRSPPRSGPPPRPPRSPISPTCPVALPTRTSSWTASVLLDNYDPQAAATLTTERPHTGAYRKTTPRFTTPTPPPPPPSTTWSEPQDSYFADRPMSHAVTTPGDEAWPLPSSPPSGFGKELTDVQEEEEDAVTKRRSRGSTRNSVLRTSQSVPALRRNSHDRESAVIPHNIALFDKPPLSPGFKNSEESWDNAIDYAYEHEAEADCDYQWERGSFDDGATIDAGPSSFGKQPAMDHHQNDDDNSIYHGRFRPSLLVPSPHDVPELSPLSNTSTASDLRTPASFLRPSRLRPVSHASSFKESHGFNLSPSLLIPHDFQSQVDQDTLYEQAFADHTTAPAMFVQVPYPSFSPIDESATSSAASFQSSDFSRGSARSSSSTRISAANSRGSQDSSSLGRSASYSHMHRSISSASSLPDLIPSMLRDLKHTKDTEVPDICQLNLKANNAPTDVTVSPPETDDTAGGVPTIHNGGVKNLVPPANGVNHINDNPLGLSPVAESFDNAVKEEASGSSHGRKVSAPIMSTTVKDFTVRARAATSSAAGAANRAAAAKRRGSYMLFPQV